MMTSATFNDVNSLLTLICIHHPNIRSKLEQFLLNTPFSLLRIYRNISTNTLLKSTRCEKITSGYDFTWDNLDQMIKEISILIEFFYLLFIKLRIIQ